MTNHNIDFLTDLANECGRALANYDSLNEDAIDFYLSISEIIRAISSIIEKEVMGNRGMLLDIDSLYESINGLIHFGVIIDFSSLNAYLER